MRRREFVLLCLIAALMNAGPWVFAQASGRVYRVGILSPSAGAIESQRIILIPELARLGFTEGQNLVIETRTGRIEELPLLAGELAATRSELVIAVGAAAIRAMKEKASDTPIVAAFMGEDPISAGFAESLSRPGGTITGILMLAPELDAKRLHLLHEVIPGGRRIAALAVDPKRDAPNIAAVSEAANRVGVELLTFYVATAGDYRAAFAAMRGAGVDAVEIVSAPELFADASTLATLAIESRVPTICEWSSMAAQGCLVGYGPDLAELVRRVADYAARILRGAAPGDLAIEGPTRFDFAVNLKTAKALGLSIPPSILARADEVIE